jgi:D-alanyl-lipoteichoic acid acyltransferase DltB (MBOAT superfamily)
MPQFVYLKNKFINWKNLSEGLFLFLIGLFKKVIVADTLSKWAGMGFDSTAHLSFLEALTSVLSYTFQIYYDFSGYTDMALGVSKMFNIDLPQNFNNPYKAIDIQDFWRRWHMTLSRFLRDYLYFPLGGSRKGKVRTYINILIVFFICGLWHGASWMFILWGILHGIASVINRLWQRTNIELPHWLSWIMTFSFVNFAWIFFRAKDFAVAKNIIKSLLGMNGFAVPKIYGATIEYFPHISNIKSWDTISLFFAPILIAVIFISFFHEIPKNLKPTWRYSLLIIMLFILAMFKILSPEYTSEFIYFNF